MIEAYRIGVSIVLANNVSPVLAIIGKDLLGLKASIKGIEQNFGGWTTAIAGFGSVLAGATVLGAMVKLAEKAGDFQDAMTKISQLNPQVAALVANGDIKRLAFDQGRALGMNVEDVTKIYGGIYGVLQDPEEASQLTPYAARYARLMQLRHPGSHPEESINTLMRAGELSGRLTDTSGAIDTKKVQGWLDMAARLEAATHGQVNANSLLALAQQGGGVSLRGLSQEGMEHMAIIAQMMGGARAGTSLLSLRQQMTGVMLKRSAVAMQDYGLLKPDEWETDKGGHVVLHEDTTRRLSALVSSDPMKFVNEIVDRLEAKGIVDRNDQMIALTRILGRQTTQRMVSDMLLARQQIARETTGLEQGATVDQGLAGYNGNIHANLANMHSAWHNLMVAIADPESEKFALVIGRITNALNGITETVNRLSPEQIDTIFQAVVGFGAGLIVLGGVLTTALVSSLVGLPVMVGAIAVGLAGLVAALNWDQVQKWLNSTSIFDSIAKALSAFIDQIIAMYGRVAGFFSITPGQQKKLNSDIDGINKPGFAPMRFEPGTSGRDQQQFAFSLNVDGHTLAQAIIDTIDGQSTFPASAPAANRAQRWAAGDDNYSDYA